MNRVFRAFEIFRSEGPRTLFSRGVERSVKYRRDFVYGWLAPAVFDGLTVNRASLIESESTDSILYRPGEQFRLRSPCRRPIPRNLEHDYLVEYHTPPEYLCSLPQAKLHRSGVVATERGDVVDDSFSTMEVFATLYMRELSERGTFGVLSGLIENRGPPNPFDRQDLERIEIGFPLLRYWNHELSQMSYGHWVLEYIPKLKGLYQFEKCRGREPAIIVEHDCPDWILEFLTLADIDESRVVPIPREGLHCETLVYPTHRMWSHYDFNPSILDLKWVREHFGGGVDGPAGGSERRIFVSREDVERRHIANRKEVIEMLAGHGFESIRPTEYSISEQIALFSDAETVIGMNGSGLQNIVFGRDIKLLEIFSPSKIGGHPLTICGLLDFEYEYYIGAESGMDVLVDTDDLEDRLLALEGN